MDSGFYWYALKRFVLVTALVVGFCLLPGPRSLIGGYFGYLLEPTSIRSLSYGTHLSLIHFCWLFGFEMPALKYPDDVEPQLTSAAIVISVLCQLGIFCGLLVLWRLGLHAYYLRMAALDEIAEFGEEELEEADGEVSEVPPLEQTELESAAKPGQGGSQRFASEVPVHKQANSSGKRGERHQIDVHDVDSVEYRAG